MATTPSMFTERVIKDDGSGYKKVKYADNVTWTVGDLPASLAGRFVFLHTCTADLTDRQLYATEGSKEFGPGFYTTCGDIEEPHKVIAQEWFETKQERFDWHVIGFSMKADTLLTFLLQNAGDQTDALKPILSFYLCHSTGYPSGKKVADETDLEGINKINKLGRVFILPSDKSVAVEFFGSTSEAKITKTWYDYTAGKCGGGPYFLIIGPQQPENMLDYRQYAWTAGWGIYLINNHSRFYKFRNYQIYGRDAGRYRAPLGGVTWPAKHPKVKPDGSKF